MSIFLEAVYHRPKLNWAYAYDLQTIHLRLRTKRNDVQNVLAITGDKYVWEQSAAYIRMDKLTSDTLFDYWQIEVKPTYRRLRYAFLLQSGKQKNMAYRKRLLAKGAEGFKRDV